MPRKYIKKKTEKRYSRNDLVRAVSDVKNRNNTYRQASQQYNVPVAVIYHRIKGRNIPENKMGSGRPTALSANVENQIADEKTIDNPALVFNADESTFGNDPSRIKAIGERVKPLSRVSGGSGRESTSVLVVYQLMDLFYRLSLSSKEM
ncbi:hypothetical protein ILUMI_26083 [Ignelater luminosus]|uniref:HTH psq-type domain-containing protein n=1 Tax=Ignelater luminosus TaxID=2038154 RepID=A0A8K0C786_IGNLU|nr:hypothetical protein ILUMI_26083 [Ignelater luminosus]